MAYRDFSDLARRKTSDKYLILQKIQNMMDIKEVLLLWFINSFIKKPYVLVLLRYKVNNWLRKYKPVIKKFKKEEFIFHSKTISGVRI